MHCPIDQKAYGALMFVRHLLTGKAYGSILNQDPFYGE